MVMPVVAGHGGSVCVCVCVVSWFVCVWGGAALACTGPRTCCQVTWGGTEPHDHAVIPDGGRKSSPGVRFADVELTEISQLDENI